MLERISGADAVGAVCQDHGDDYHVVLQFDGQAAVVEVVEETGVVYVEDGLGDLLELCEGVSHGVVVLPVMSKIVFYLRLRYICILF